MPYKEIGNIIYEELPNGKLKSVGISDSIIKEDLTPEVSAKAKEIFKAMINDRRDSLFKEYGVEAEKVAYGKAIAQAKKEMAEPIEEINSIKYLQEQNNSKLI